jgi:hypothetical protein
MRTTKPDPEQEPSEATSGEPVPGLPGRVRDPRTKVFLPAEPVDVLTADERADIERQHAALIADLGPNPSAAHVIIAGQIRDVLTDLARLRHDVDKHGAFAANGRRLRSAFAAVTAAQDRLAVLLKLMAPAKSSGRKRGGDPAAAVAAFNAAIDARNR